MALFKNIMFPPIFLFCVLVLHLDWSDVCIEQMVDLQLQHCMPNWQLLAFTNLKGRSDVSLSGKRLWVVSNVCLNECNILAVVNIEGVAWLTAF